MSREWSKFLAVAAALGLGLGASTAAATPKALVVLDYRVDPSLAGCPDEAAFHAMVESQLGYDPFRRDAQDRVVARMDAEPGRTHGTIEWRDGAGTLRGERELTSGPGACAELARTMSFAIAVQIQLLEREGTNTASEPVPAQPSRAAPGMQSHPPSATHPRPSAEPQTDAASERSPGAEPSAPRFVLGAGALVAFGIAPEWAVEGRVFAALRGRRLSLELGVETGFPSEHRTSSDAGFEQHVVVGTSAGCVALRPFSACVVGKAGRLKVRGFGVDEPHSASGFIALVGPRVGFEQGFGDHWLAALRVEVLATLVPWSIQLNHQDVWRTPVGTFLVGADLANIFQ